MVDWHFCDRAPFSTQVYPGRSHLSQPKKGEKKQQKKTGESTHTKVLFRGGAFGFV